MYETRAINLSVVDGTMSVLAKCRGSLAVHPMAREEGFCISHAATGLRMSWKYRVFKSEEAAIAVADSMLESGIDWTLFFSDPRPQSMLDIFCSIHARAEADGAFLRDVVAPAGVMPPGATWLIAD